MRVQYVEKQGGQKRAKGTGSLERRRLQLLFRGKSHFHQGLGILKGHISGTADVFDSLFLHVGQVWVGVGHRHNLFPLLLVEVELHPALRYRIKRIVPSTLHRITRVVRLSPLTDNNVARNDLFSENTTLFTLWHHKTTLVNSTSKYIDTSSSPSKLLNSKPLSNRITSILYSTTSLFCCISHTLQQKIGCHSR